MNQLAELLQKDDLDALLISSPANIFYVTQYAGFSSTEREAYVLITKKGKYLITDPRYTFEVKNVVPSFTILERNAQHTITQLFQEIVSKQKLYRVGFEADNLTVAEHTALKKAFLKFLPVNIRTLREIKTPQEMNKIINACKIGDQAFAYIQKQLKENRTEKQLADDLENFIRQQGAEPSFPTIVGFGANAAAIHHHTDNIALRKNQFILLDFGVQYENYCSDMSRTCYFGKPNDEEKKVYQTVLTAQQKAVTFIKEKLKKKQEIKASDVDKIARDYIVSQKYPPFPHSLGHGIGILVHEAPTITLKSTDKLMNGMVFSIEPGIYLKNKFGIRIEDIYAIQKGQLVQLTQATKTELIIISS